MIEMEFKSQVSTTNYPSTADACDLAA